MIVYLLKSGACLGILFIFYILFLEKENMHVFKRFYLLFALIIALVIPHLVFTEYLEIPAQTNITPQSTVSSSELSYSTTTPTENVIDTQTTLWSIYGIGVLFFAFRFFKNLKQIHSRIRKNPKHKLVRFTQVLLEEKITPHTFFNYIFLNRKKLEANEIPEEVLLHEETHARQKHSLDVIFIELLQIVFWCNPFVYLTKKAIKLNHEFLADQAVLKETIDTKAYQNTLLSYLSSNSDKNNSSKLANAINYSSIKKRFSIMSTHTSKKAILLRSFLLLPLVVILLYGFSETKLVEKAGSKIEEINSVQTNNRIIEIAGLIYDSETVKPLGNVEILDTNGAIISKTDERGFYKAKININTEGEIIFNLSIKKDGYTTLTQNEHWGNLSGKIEASLFIGLKKEGSKGIELGDLFTSVNSLSYASIEKNFDRVKTNIFFRKKIENAKNDNQNVFFKIEKQYYLVNNTSWIKINSKEDLITINENKVVKAYNINSHIKRNEITSMTPLEKRNKAQYALYTDGRDLVQEGTSKEQLAEYNVLAEKYNALLKKEHFTIKMTDVKRLEYLYSIMSKEQKANAEPFPNFPKPPPVPDAPDFKETLKELEKTKTLLQKEAKELKKQSNLLKVDTEKLKQNAPPKPPKPLSPVEFIIKNSKEGGTFYYNNKEISSDKAITLVTKNKDKDIYLSKMTNSKNKKIKIVIKPKATGSASKEINILEYAKELAYKKAQFYYNNKPISINKGIKLIEDKKYTSVETLPWVNKVPEVKIFN